MNQNTTSLSIKGFDDLLKKYKLDKTSTLNITNTRIGDKNLGIYGGSYSIEYNEEFWDSYYKHIFVNRNKEYLTETQIIENSPILIDIDLRYDKSIKERQHTKEHITDLLYLYTEKLNEIYKINDNFKFDIYVMEKDKVNIFDDKVKDGIHIIMCLSMHKAEQVYLRRKILEEMDNLWSLPILNSFEEVFDEGITKGFVNWQLYGSRKPGHKPYNITYYFTAIYSEEEDYWKLQENNILKINVRETLPLLSAKYDKHQQLELLDNEYVLEAINIEKQNINIKNSNKKLLETPINIDIDITDYSKINNMVQLDYLISLFINDVTISDYELKETHYFTMSLPESYYNEGSYNKWIRVGWALKNTNEKLFLTWMKFSSQSNKFDFNDLPKYYSMWKSFNFKHSDKLSNRSIMYWAKNDNFQQYELIRKDTVTYYVEQSVECLMKKDKIGEFDLAIVLYQMFKDLFVCVSIKNNIWYEYKKNRWVETDSGNSLRIRISKDMYGIYFNKCCNTMIKKNELQINNKEDENLRKILQHKIEIYGNIAMYARSTSWKNNIMKEAKELFYDEDFMKKLDANPELLCFNNYIIDFKNNIYRNGKPDDFISKSTNIDYIPYNKLTGKIEDTDTTFENVKQEIYQFMDELFPDSSLRQYMWDHLASVLIGRNENQTFNIYNGSGANGKSVLVALMTECLGDYKATIPITLITQNRNNIGSTSSEIVQLMGIRYACMQEPSKGDKINEGIMKEITGGDPLTGRALYKDSITFIPQFKLVVCTNVMFDINTNDDGTWRRIRVVDFESKFIDNPYQNEDKFPKSNFPYQFQVDKKIDKKFKLWAPVFMSILVNLAFEKQGKVIDVPKVTIRSDIYRNSQDYLTEFTKERLQRKKDGSIKKSELLEEFKNWYIANYGRATLPKGKEISDHIEKLYGKCKNDKWRNIELIYNYDDDNDDDE